MAHTMILTNRCSGSEVEKVEQYPRYRPIVLTQYAFQGSSTEYPSGIVRDRRERRCVDYHCAFLGFNWFVSGREVIWLTGSPLRQSTTSQVRRTALERSSPLGKVLLIPSPS
jgi:hypothetical protein